MHKIVHIFLFLFISSTSLANQRIEVFASANVEAGRVTLPSIAKLTGFSSESVKLLNGLVIVDQMKRGETRKFSDQAIADLLRKKIQTLKTVERRTGKDFNLVLKLPKLLSISVNAPIWTKKTVLKTIEANNKNFCSQCTYKLERLSFPKLEYKGVRKWDIELPEKLISGSFQLPLKVYFQEKSRAQTFYIGGKITAFKKMPVAKRNIRAGTRIQKTDIVWEKRKWNFTRRDIGTEKEIVGAKLRRTALSGSILWLSNIEREKAVERGDLVDIIVKKDDWSMKMKGVAQKSGVLGDRLPILNRSSKKVLIGRVTGKQEVELQ